MAYRDTRQGFGFVYFDLKTFLQHKNEWIQEGDSPWQDYGVPTVRIPEPQAEPANTERIKSLKSSLDRLQNLHHRLQVMLEDIQTSAPRKNRKK